MEPRVRYRAQDIRHREGLNAKGGRQQGLRNLSIPASLPHWTPATRLAARLATSTPATPHRLLEESIPPKCATWEREDPILKRWAGNSPKHSDSN